MPMALAVGVFLTLAGNGTARADLVFETVGDPVDAQSWYQSFHLHTPSAFQTVGILLQRLAGDDLTSGFKAPAWEFISVGTADSPYTGTWINPDRTRATGGLTTDLVWNQHFEGDRDGQRFQLTLYVWDTQFQNIQSGSAIWDGTNWNFNVAPGVTWEQFVAMGGVAGVPAPSAALLGMLGLGLVGSITRKLR